MQRLSSQIEACHVPSARERGMTIVELMVTIAIIVLFIAIGIVGIGAVRDADVDATASVLAGASRYVYTLAIHTNKTHRLVIDMDEKKFWTEVAEADDPCARYIPEGNYDDQNPQLGEDGQPAQREGINRLDSAEEIAETAARSAFKRDDHSLLKREFRPSTNITGVITEHHQSMQTSGRAAIYFYPTGRAERAMIWVGEESDEDIEPPTYTPELTIQLHSLGRVTRTPEVLLESDFARKDER